MNDFKVPVLAPIRFYPPGMEFDNSTYFQNPDNRVSHGYNYPNVHAYPYAMAIPKQWPDGQPGIDTMVTLDDDSDVNNFYAKLYDEDDEEYKDVYAELWEPVTDGTMYRIYLNGNDGSGVADGYYTIKLFDSSDDSLLLESEPLLIADWFTGMAPLEYFNFENDFGCVFDNGVTMWTGRILVPVTMHNPEPQFEKEVYKDDPGTLVTLRTVIERGFNFDIQAMPVHLAEQVMMAFSCSELYLDRIKINAEEAPTGELIEGTNLMIVSGRAILVEFNDEYVRERAERIFNDEEDTWLASDYDNTSGLGTDTLVVDDSYVSGSPKTALTTPYAAADEELVLFKLELTDNATGGNTSDLPDVSLDGGYVELFEWGTHWMSIRLNADTNVRITLRNTTGERAQFTAKITVYSLGEH